ncbi:LL-diaminopimelate aminotransferase [Flavobacteriaceae bacterium UJ101]|nr:LL-diaminopimelate aminotransferase [Flavobacteriaceae bacterium UJ101]
MIQTAQRLQHIKEYYFSIKLKEIKRRNEAGENIINLGIGSPDLLPPTSVIKALQNTSEELLANKYQSYIGTDDLRKEISNWYAKHFNISLNPSNEILPLLGSKEGIMHISMTFLNKGDCVLVPNPGYPTYSSVSNLVEASILSYDLEESNHWLPSLEQLKSMPLDQVKIMWINYPNMPTGAKGDQNILEELIQLAIKHNFIIVNDNPYSFILNDDPISILQLKDAKKCCLELNSLSKLYNMAGWRVGMVSGNEKLITEILKVKSNVDSGMYLPIQKGAIEALKQPKSWFDQLNQEYRNRRKLVWEICDHLNLSYDKNRSGMFIWAKIQNKQNSIDWCEEKLNTNKVFITPGTIFGSNGEGYVRFSLCAPAEVLKESLDRLTKNLTKIEYH